MSILHRHESIHTSLNASSKLILCVFRQVICSANDNSRMHTKCSHNCSWLSFPILLFIVKIYCFLISYPLCCSGTCITHLQCYHLPSTSGWHYNNKVVANLNFTYERAGHKICPTIMSKIIE